MNIDNTNINDPDLFSDSVKIVDMPDGRKYLWPAYDTQTVKYLSRFTSTPDNISQHVDRRGTMVQAGGNCGYYVKLFAEQFETVYTFEPESLNFLCLTANTYNMDNVIRLQACVGNEKKLLKTQCDDKQCGSTHISADAGKVPTLLIDELGLESCDLIQLDTEGFEYFGLLGAKQTIKKFLPVIVIEWCTPWAERYGVTYEMVTDFLAPYGYEKIARYDADIVFKIKQ
jgi:FkbM family methyltransferase